MKNVRDFIKSKCVNQIDQPCWQALSYDARSMWNNNLFKEPNGLYIATTNLRK